MRSSAVLLLSLILGGCSSPVAPPPAPTLLKVNYAPSAISIPGQHYDTIEVRLFDDAGRAVVDWPVTWTGDGEVIPFDEKTDGVGIARARWILPRTTLFYNGETDGPVGTFMIHAEAVGVGGVSMSTEARPYEVDSVVTASGFACGWRGIEFWCWGGPWSVGPLTRLPHRVSLPNGDRIFEAAAASNALCVIDESGAPWCDDHGEIGTLLRIGGAPPLHGLHGGNQRMCGLSQHDNTPWCWMTFTYPGPPVATQRIELPVTTLAESYDFGCGLMADSTAWCWGENAHGQLGIGTTAPAEGAQPVVGGHRFVALAAADYVGCGATSEGAVWCWGFFRGIGTFPSPQLVDDRPGVFQQLLVGWMGEVYVVRDGEARVILTEIDEFLNDRYFTGRQVRQLSGAYESICMVLVSDQVWCSVSTFGGYRTHANYPEVVGPVPDPRSDRTRQPATSGG